ncbi:MAG: nitrile hydratase subunit beta [Pseudomonadales bacterium]
MDGIHDLGGKHGFGKVIREEHEPVFHHRWEAAVFTMVQASAAAGALRNTDQFRHAVERVDPAAYLLHGYYGRWLGGVENLLVEAGIVSQQEINARAAREGAPQNDLIAARPADNPDPAGPAPRHSHSRRSAAKPRFAVGDQVRTAREVKAGHTRLPAYARGCIGTIIRHHEGWVYPDTNAHGLGEQPVNLYTVQFEGEELWGGGDPNIKVSLDLFEPYLLKVIDSR